VGSVLGARAAAFSALPLRLQQAPPTQGQERARDLGFVGPNPREKVGVGKRCVLRVDFPERTYVARVWLYHAEKVGVGKRCV